ncbi:MAG: hypothetical protein GDA50_04355 [Alphaproteobacteria bacterium GM202ARS2]|nr:hypothetical protein [Alphaproteobacteria bacterium GM202ARS2]
MTEERIVELGGGTYSQPRQLPTGEWACIGRMLFTWALVIGVTEQSTDRRYCYEREQDARSALETWDGIDDPPGPWIKEKPSNRINSEWAKAK